MKISKEVLDEVLNIKVSIEDMQPYIQHNTLVYDVYCDGLCTRNINIYELSYRCKEWINKQGYTFSSFGKECFLYETLDLEKIYYNTIEWCKYFTSSKEINCIFKACQWIIDNNKKV